MVYGKVISATGTLANVNPLRYRGSPYPGSGTKVIYNGYVMTPEDIGNFTYGYLGRAFDFSETELIIGSWVAASFPLGGDALENELRDQEFIRMGYAWNGIN